ncbi:MAG: DUF6986 family protein [Pseudomonadota bacterium]
MTRTTLSIDDLSPLLARLTLANETFAARFPGVPLIRQPVHTVYGGAHLYKPGAAAKLGQLARASFSTHAPDVETLARALGFAGYTDKPPTPDEARIARLVYERVVTKLNDEPVEDHRVDFEDGYGTRTDDEEDEHAVAAALAMAEGLETGALPGRVGIRIKALTEEARARSLRTLDIFLTTLTLQAGQLPEDFVVTLPKVTSEAQVSVLAETLALLENRLSLAAKSIRIELMIETIQSILTADGRVRIPALVQAGQGRVSAAILGTFDYTASCNIASTWQDHRHPAADFARHMMQVALTGTAVFLSDGITNVMPIGPHRGELTAAQQAENQAVVHSAWKLHFDNILHSLRLGFYQGWDLNPAQIPVRFAAVYYFFLTGVEDSIARLQTFVDRAAQASLTGNTFDDAATGQGLVNFFVSGLNCGALTGDEVARTGVSPAELAQRSFLKIVEARLST